MIRRHTNRRLAAALIAATFILGTATTAFAAPARAADFIPQPVSWIGITSGSTYGANTLLATSLSPRSGGVLWMATTGIAEYGTNNLPTLIHPGSFYAQQDLQELTIINGVYTFVDINDGPRIYPGGNGTFGTTSTGWGFVRSPYVSWPTLGGQGYYRACGQVVWNGQGSWRCTPIVSAYGNF